MTVTDDAGQTATQSLDVKVDYVDSLVEIELVTPVTVTEGETSVTTVPYTNKDSGNDVTFSIIGGADEDLFEIDDETGELSFIDTPDAENPLDSNQDGSYELKIKLMDDTDGDTSSKTATVTVNLEDISDEKPEAVSAALGASFTNAGSTELSELAVTIAETTATSATLLTVLFNNGESSLIAANGNATALNLGPDLTFALESDASTDNFSLSAPSISASDTAGSAIISLVSGAELDYETDPEIELTLTVTDEDSGATAQTAITVTLSPVDELPIYTAPSAQSVASNRSEVIGDEIVASMKDPENEDIFFVVTAPENGTTNSAEIDYGRAVYNPENLSNVDFYISPGASVSLSYDEMKTLEFHGWDSDSGDDNNSETDPSGVPILEFKYWAFNTKADADAFADDTSIADTSSSGSINLYVVDAEVA